MNKGIKVLGGALGGMLVLTGVAFAQQLAIDVNKISDTGVGEKIGTVSISEGKKGVSFKVAITGLAPGKHGFHVHEKGDCAAASKDGKMEPGWAAGPHYDPDHTRSHKGPQG